MPKVDRKLTARENIQKLAEAERAGAKGSGEDARTDVAMPPSVEPAILTAREPGSAAHDRAGMQLREALGDVAANAPADAGRLPEQAPVDPEAKAEALEHLEQGRREAGENRHLAAVIALQKALQLDPSSTDILRALAYSYQQVGNAAQAVECLEKLVRIDPLDSEAAFSLGLAAANRREFAKAVDLLGRVRLANHAFDHDPAAELLVDFTLGVALRELGYDRASIEASTAAVAHPAAMQASTLQSARMGSVYRQRGEIWRSIGDAHCRLGEFEQALAAYEQSSALPTADPTALHPRVVYANLRLGRVFSAQWTVLAALDQAEGEAISERDIRLCGYVREQAKPLDLLAEAVRDLYRSRPDDSGLVRAAASLTSPEDARAVLKEFVGRRPRDVQSVSHLLVWLAEQDVPAAVGLAIDLTAEHPDLADEYIDRLAVAIPRPATSIEAARAAEPSAARSRVEARLLAKIGGLGEAWTVCQQGRQQWPDDAGLLLQELQLAAAMQEAAIFERTLGVAGDRPDVRWLLGVSQGRRALGQTKSAVELAQRAVALEPDNIEALIELARAQGAHAVTTVGPDRKPSEESRQEIEQAVRSAELAIANAPQREEGYEVLALIYAPGGVLADTRLYAETRERVGRANPGCPLYARLSAQDALGHKRYEQALERLLGLYDSNPADRASLTQAVTVWQQWGKLDAAEQWLSERLAQREGDPALTEQWVRVQILRDRAEEATQRLEGMIDADPDDLFARRLLEGVYRALGQADSERELGEQRLLARPEGVRRELELAALYLRAELADKTLARLEWIRQHIEDADLDDLTGAIEIAQRLPDDDGGRDALTQDLVEHALERFPAAPLEVYRAGLLALAREDRLDSAFRELAERASTTAKGAEDATLQSAVGWRDLAQALVDDGEPEAAALAVRARLMAPMSLADNNVAALGKIAIVADAAAAAAALEALNDPSPDQAEAAVAPHVERTMELIRYLNGKGLLSMTMTNPGRMALSEGYSQASSLYSLLGVEIGAQRLLRETVELNPKDAMAMNNLGYLRLESGFRDDQTMEWIHSAYKIESEEPNILDTVGWLRYKQGRFDDWMEADAEQMGARSLVSKAIDRDRDPSPEVYDHLGDICWRQGDTEAAVEAWRKTVRLADESDMELRLKQSFQMEQARWRLIVSDPQDFYDREYGQIIERARGKLEAVERGEAPQVAPTWQEAQQ